MSKKEKIFVPHCDKDKKVQELKLALELVGIRVDYIGADLIYSTMQVFNRKRGKMNLMDAAKISAAHEDKWDHYLTEQIKKEKQELKELEDET